MLEGQMIRRFGGREEGREGGSKEECSDTRDLEGRRNGGLEMDGGKVKGMRRKMVKNKQIV